MLREVYSADRLEVEAITPSRVGTAAQNAALIGYRNATLVVLAALLAASLLARALRRWRGRRTGLIRLTYPDRVIRIPRGLSVLEASLRHEIPHAHVCGGRGRCSTCRVRILGDLGALPPASAAEQAVLDRVGAGVGVRLACQLRPTGDIAFVPMLPPHEDACQAAISACVAIADNVEKLNGALAYGLLEPLRFGIGIHAGLSIAGEIGYERHAQFTVIGDPVNVAARLQVLTKSVGCEVLMSEEVYARAGFDVDDLPRHEVEARGREAGVKARSATRAADLVILKSLRTRAVASRRVKISVLAVDRGGNRDAVRVRIQSVGGHCAGVGVVGSAASSGAGGSVTQIGRSKVRG